MTIDFEAEKKETETARIRRRKQEREWLVFKLGALLALGFIVLLIIWLVTK
jgi:hypothetical protein